MDVLLASSVSRKRTRHSCLQEFNHSILPPVVDACIVGGCWLSEDVGIKSSSCSKSHHMSDVLARERAGGDRSDWQSDWTVTDVEAAGAGECKRARFDDIEAVLRANHQEAAAVSYCLPGSKDELELYAEGSPKSTMTSIDMERAQCGRDVGSILDWQTDACDFPLGIFQWVVDCMSSDEHETVSDGNFATSARVVDGNFATSARVVDVPSLNDEKCVMRCSSSLTKSASLTSGSCIFDSLFDVGLELGGMGDDGSGQVAAGCGNNFAGSDGSTVTQAAPQEGTGGLEFGEVDSCLGNVCLSDLPSSFSSAPMINTAMAMHGIGSTAASPTDLALTNCISIWLGCTPSLEETRMRTAAAVAGNHEGDMSRVILQGNGAVLMSDNVGGYGDERKSGQGSMKELEEGRIVDGMMPSLLPGMLIGEERNQDFGRGFGLLSSTTPQLLEEEAAVGLIQPSDSIGIDLVQSDVEYLLAGCDPSHGGFHSSLPLGGSNWDDCCFIEDDADSEELYNERINGQDDELRLFAPDELEAECSSVSGSCSGGRSSSCRDRRAGSSSCWGPDQTGESTPRGAGDAGCDLGDDESSSSASVRRGIRMAAREDADEDEEEEGEEMDSAHSRGHWRQQLAQTAHVNDVPQLDGHAVSLLDMSANIDNVWREGGGTSGEAGEEALMNQELLDHYHLLNGHFRHHMQALDGIDFPVVGSAPSPHLESLHDSNRESRGEDRKTDRIVRCFTDWRRTEEYQRESQHSCFLLGVTTQLHGS